MPCSFYRCSTRVAPLLNMALVHLLQKSYFQGQILFHCPNKLKGKCSVSVVNPSSERKTTRYMQYIGVLDEEIVFKSI